MINKFKQLWKEGIGQQEPEGFKKFWIDKKEDDTKWITVRGAHIPIKNGQDVGQALKEHFQNLKDRKGVKPKGEKKEGGKESSKESSFGKKDPKAIERHNKYHDRKMPTDLDIYTEETKEKIPSKPGHLCFDNSLKIAKQKGLKLMGGFSIKRTDWEAEQKGGLKEKEKGTWAVHAWNLDKEGKIYDTTYGKSDEEHNKWHKGYVYVGKEVPLKGLKNDEDVERYINENILDIKKK